MLLQYSGAQLTIADENKFKMNETNLSEELYEQIFQQEKYGYPSKFLIYHLYS